MCEGRTLEARHWKAHGPVSRGIRMDDDVRSRDVTQAKFPGHHPQRHVLRIDVEKLVEATCCNQMMSPKCRNTA